MKVSISTVNQGLQFISSLVQEIAAYEAEQTSSSPTPTATPPEQTPVDPSRVFGQ
ncbi:hypothetical protein [Nostoc sp.]|uniref:hypothetical protein n=1 Tax=Nostoc sp. TaxID=1180 RepID=UPI002FF64DA8